MVQYFVIFISIEACSNKYGTDSMLCHEIIITDFYGPNSSSILEYISRPFHISLVQAESIIHLSDSFPLSLQLNSFGAINSSEYFISGSF